MQHGILIFLMGPTCSGKSTLLQKCQQRVPGKVGLVEVGKALRAKYPPSHFAGQNNPKHTADEAWQLCEEGVEREIRLGRTHIMIDGQPRDVPQVGLCIKQFPGMTKRFVLLTASLEVREARARQNRSDNPENLELALKRLTNDMIAYYSVMAELSRRAQNIEVFDTTEIPYTEEAVTNLSKAVLHF